jgi:hypothetical protein
MRYFLLIAALCSSTPSLMASSITCKVTSESEHVHQLQLVEPVGESPYMIIELSKALGFDQETRYEVRYATHDGTRVAFPAGNSNDNRSMLVMQIDDATNKGILRVGDQLLPSGLISKYYEYNLTCESR